jgi:hypothetical protein
MDLAQTIKARETLEMLRVKALHNEFSGKPFYRDPEDHSCMCVIGSLLPPHVHEAIELAGDDSCGIGILLRSSYSHLLPDTGLSADQLSRLQRAHDDLWRYEDRKRSNSETQNVVSQLLAETLDW